MRDSPFFTQAIWKGNLRTEHLLSYSFPYRRLAAEKQEPAPMGSHPHPSDLHAHNLRPPDLHSCHQPVVDVLNTRPSAVDVHNPEVALPEELVAGVVVMGCNAGITNVLGENFVSTSENQKACPSPRLRRCQKPCISAGTS